MSQKFKTVGEGGTHLHKIAAEKNRTDVDGKHKHIFYVNDRLLMTDLDGEHAHLINTDGYIGGPVIEHKHKLYVKTVEGDLEFETIGVESHWHELQADSTTLSGVHRHTVRLGDTYFLSLVPQDLIAAANMQAQKSKKFSNLIFKSNDILEMDYTLVKKLNEPQFKQLLSSAVESSIIKRMSQMGSGLRIESLILSRVRFADVGVATRFVLDQGLDVKSSNVMPEIFTFQVLSRESFEESTLQRIRITEGVDAVVGFLSEQEQSSNESVVAQGTINQLQDKEEPMPKPEEENKPSLQERLAETLSKFPDISSLKQTDKAQVEKGANKNVRVAFEMLQKNDEKRLVTGPVLIPENVDLQDDIVSADEIEKAGHGYMIKLAFRDDPEFLMKLGFSNVKSERGFMHVEFSRKIAVVESYMAPVSFEMNGRMVIKGTWMMTMKVFDDEVWALVKAGKITGFSIGGRGKSIPEE